MEIYNISKKKQPAPCRNELAPKNPFRLLCCGPTGSGKTVAIGSMIINDLYYDRVYIYAKHINDEDDIYGDLIKFLLKAEKKMQKKLKDPNFKMIWIGNKYDEIPSVDMFDPNYYNLLIVDDFMNVKKQQKINDIFTDGRHSKVSIIYLTQRYTSVSPVIRSNCNYFMFFEFPNKTEMMLIAKEQATDLSYDELQQLFMDALHEPYSFLVIDRKTQDKSCRYRKKWSELFFGFEQ